MYAPHNPQLENFEDFFDSIHKLETGQPFHIARYNDGEWIFILQIKPYYLLSLHHGKHCHEEVRPISDYLLEVLKRKPPYLIGIDSNTQAHKGPISAAVEQYQELLPPNLVYGEIFNAATVMFGIDVLARPLRQRFTITVGPEYMKLLKLGSNHITVPEHNCWTSAEAVKKELQQLIDDTLHEQPVIVYSCSILAKWLIDVMYQIHGDSITQLDIGSCIDPWCGLATRPWHAELIKHFGIRLKFPPVILPKTEDPEACIQQPQQKSHAPLLPRKVDTTIEAFKLAIRRGAAAHALLKKQQQEQERKKQEEAQKISQENLKKQHVTPKPVKIQPERLTVLPASISTGRPAPRTSFK